MMKAFFVLIHTGTITCKAFLRRRGINLHCKNTTVRNCWCGGLIAIGYSRRRLPALNTGPRLRHAGQQAGKPPGAQD